MKRSILFLLTCVFPMVLCAVPARRGTIQMLQSDGTVLSVVLMGDEYMHYYQNTQTGEKLYRGSDGDLHAFSLADFKTRLEGAAIRRQVANMQRVQRLKPRPAQSKVAPNRVGVISGGITGEKKGLVVLVNFADKALDVSHTQSTFDNQFNQKDYSVDGHVGSVHDYFYDQSYGLFDLNFDVVGPVTLQENMAYYGGNDSRGNDMHPAQMVKEACILIDDEVDFADYDWDGDGYVDQVYVIYAGYGENYSGSDENTIWPHEWDLVSAGVGNVTLDGVNIKTYACSAELCGTKGTNLNGIGTACHEFSHCLGYPDFYDTDYSGGIGMDSYDVMCGGSYNGPSGRGEVPAGFTAYERYMAGWLQPDILEQCATVTAMPALNDEAKAFIIYNAGNKNEYFLLENRQARKWFQYYDRSIAGHGLFVTHVDEDKTAWSANKANDNPAHQRMTWIPADGLYGNYDSTRKSWKVSGAEAQGDFFPGTMNVTSLTNTSHLDTGGRLFNENTDGSYYMNHELTEIAETNGMISFLFDGGATASVMSLVDIILGKVTLEETGIDLKTADVNNDGEVNVVDVTSLINRMLKR